MKRLLAVAGASEGLVVETISMTQEDGDTTVRGLLGEGVVEVERSKMEQETDAQRAKGEKSLLDWEVAGKGRRE